ncbi:CASP-like protein 2A1 [Primulina tabacum]|uniref:CASP-like protein 2A1 n=1 Tax=Primulina tabacum TaxID=48773 RepID=UPI003F59BFF2
MSKESAIPVGSSPAEMGANEVDGSGSAMRTVETLLRILPMVLCVVALVVMLKNSQSNEYGSLSYSDLGAFRYLVHASGICAGYSLLSAIAAAVSRQTNFSMAWAFFLLDQLLTYIILAAGAISTEVVYLAYKGDTAITWSETCSSFGGFCRKATASIAITFIVTLCYAGLSLISAYRLFSKFEAPVAYTDKGIEIATFQT